MKTIHIPETAGKIRRSCFMILVLTLFIFVNLSCVEPVPLYGTWADNRGNSLSFYDDGTFNSAITGPGDETQKRYSGNYTLLLNSLTLKCTDVDLQVVTEWDIRGNMLYLDWPVEDGTMSLTLYKISN